MPTIPSLLCPLPGSSQLHFPASQREAAARQPSRGSRSPCLPSIGAGSSLTWRSGSSRRAQTCRVSATSQRRSRCHFPPPLSRSIDFSFALHPVHPPRRRGVNAATDPGEDTERAKSLGHGTAIPFLHGMMSLLSYSSSFPAPPAIFSPLHQDFGILPARTGGGEGQRGYPRVPGLPGAGAFLPTAQCAHPGHRHLAGAGGDSRGPLAAEGPRDAAGSCRFPA